MPKRKSSGDIMYVTKYGDVRRKPTAPEFTPRRSKFMRDEHEKDERQLAAVVLTIMIGGLTLIALHYSGTFDWFISLFE